FGRLGNHLYITINSTGEVLKVQDHFNSTNYGVEQVRFADNTSWDRAQILAAAWFIGTSAGETIDGSSGNDTIDGRGGNDRLVGHGGADTYLFGLGSDNDTIAEGSVASDGSGDTVKLVGLNIADVEFSRSGNDLFVKVVSSGETLKVENQFNGDNGIETVAFANGTSWDRNQIVAASWYRGGTGDDSISSSSGSDILSGGLGNDYLRGNAGSDLYVYTSGDGNDRIDDESASTAEIDTLRFTDLNASDLTFSRVGGDLAISVIATGQIVTVNYQFYSKTANWGIEKIEFADGTSWDLATINSHAWIRGTSGNDTIGGSDWNDIFWGGLGNDRFNSGAGSDTYFYALGDGNDYIDDESGSTADVDVLHLTD
ncbi:MAG: calcium-binding protein, partial [Candidatus Zixiibacteriota bacterium]